MESSADMYSIVNVKNIGKDDFSCELDKIEYSIRKGETRGFPRFLADHVVKHLIDHLILQQDDTGKTLLNVQKRRELASRIVVNYEELVAESVPVTKKQEERRTISDLDSVLGGLKSKMASKEPAKTSTEPTTPEPQDEGGSEDKEEFEGLKDDPDEATPAQEIPTREEMIKYAKNTLKVNVTDKKTLAAWDKLSDEELAKELGIIEEAK